MGLQERGDSWSGRWGRCLGTEEAVVYSEKLNSPNTPHQLLKH